MMKHKAIFIIAGCMIALAAFMKFAMVGYGFMALVICALAAALVLFTVLTAPFRIVLALLIAAFLALFGYWEVQIVRSANTDAPADADYLILLGCGVRGTTPSVAMRNRCGAAAGYLKANPSTTVICSGGQGPGEDLSEALAMKQLLTASGIAEDRILLEERSTSTEENLLFSAEIIGDISGKNIVICSSEYHIFRARFLSEQLFGRRFDGLPAHSTLPVSRINYFMREAAGMMVVNILR